MKVRTYLTITEPINVECEQNQDTAIHNNYIKSVEMRKINFSNDKKSTINATRLCVHAILTFVEIVFTAHLYNSWLFV